MEMDGLESNNRELSAAIEFTFDCIERIQTLKA